MRVTARWATVIVGAGLVACGNGATGGAADLAMPAQDFNTVETCSSDGQPVQLAKHYGIHARLVVNVKVPSDCAGDACLVDKDAPAGLLLLADVTQTGSTATVTARACQIAIPPVALKGQMMATQLTASDALVQSVPMVMSLTTIGGASTCAGLSSSPLALVLGAHLMAPATDPLPTFSGGSVKLCGGKPTTLCSAATDFGCICDQEGDGKRGATVMATGVPVVDDVDQIYLALRTAFAMDGMVFPPSSGQSVPGQRLKGTISHLSLEQSPVGCHRSGNGGMDCDDATTGSVAGFNPKVTQSANQASTFVGMPVADGTTCAQLVAGASTIFAGQ